MIILSYYLFFSSVSYDINPNIKAMEDICNAFCSGFVVRGNNTEVTNDIREFGRIKIDHESRVIPQG